jgi:transcriptional regulator with XRE-family HTH domain
METITGPEDLLAWRTAQNLSQREVGEGVGVAQSMVSFWEARSRRPTIIQAIMLEGVSGGVVRAEAWGHPPERLALIRAAASGASVPVGSSFTTSDFAVEPGHESETAAVDAEPSGPVVVRDGFDQTGTGG